MFYKYYVKIRKFVNDEEKDHDAFGYGFTNTEARMHMIEKVSALLEEYKENCTCTVNMYDATIIAGNVKLILDVQYIYG